MAFFEILENFLLLIENSAFLVISNLVIRLSNGLDNNRLVFKQKTIFSPLFKQARKGFRPPSAMKGIGYFPNL